jgi:HAMP domain-containing protein
MLPTAEEFESARAKRAEDETERLQKEIETLRQQLQTPTS